MYFMLTMTVALGVNWSCSTSIDVNQVFVLFRYHM